MKKAIAISLILLGLLTCVGLSILIKKMITERYKTLRTIGMTRTYDTDGHLYKKYPRMHNKRESKYGKGTNYDRAKLRYNRFQKNYV
jgi:hypothetical protein